MMPKLEFNFHTDKALQRIKIKYNYNSVSIKGRNETNCIVKASSTISKPLKVNVISVLFESCKRARKEKAKMFMSLKSNPQYQLWKIIFRCYFSCCHKNLFRIKKVSFVLFSRAKWNLQQKGNRAEKRELKCEDFLLAKSDSSIKGNQKLWVNRIIVLRRLQQLEMKLAELLWVCSYD